MNTTCVSQLPAVLKNPESYVHSTFFTEQLTAFEVCLNPKPHTLALNPKAESLKPRQQVTAIAVCLRRFFLPLPEPFVLIKLRF